MESVPINKPNITDIVVGINDFLIEADTVSGGLYIGKMGGVGLLAKCAMNEDQYLMKKFFGYINDVPPKEPYENQYYYDDMLIPPILMEHLLNNDTAENILTKVRDHIEKTAKWMDRKGILAIADITFSDEISSDYMKPNDLNMKIVKLLSNDYTIHILGNFNRITMNKMVDKKIFEHVNGNIITSSDLKELKCSKGNNYNIYHKFFQQCGIDPVTALFIETHQGHIDSLIKYGESIGIEINTLLYNKDDRDSFVSELSSITNKDMSSVSNSVIDTVGEIVEDKETTDNVSMRRIGSVIAGFGIKDGKMYEHLIDKEGRFYVCFEGNFVSEISAEEYMNNT